MVTMDSPSAHRNKEPIWSVIEASVLPFILPLVACDDPDSNKQITHESFGLSSSSSSSTCLSVLEIAAGCGVHTTHFASRLHQKNIGVRWIATDPDPPSLESLRERVREYQRDHGVSTATASDAAEDDGNGGRMIPLCEFQTLPLTLVPNGIVESETVGIMERMKQSLNLMICINMIHISPWGATIGLFHVAQEYLKKGGILLTYGPYKRNGTAVASNLAFDESLRARNGEWGVRDLERVEGVANEKGMVLVNVMEMPANNLCLIFQKK